MVLKINGKSKEVKVEPGMPLLWVLRDELNMTGTKYGCGVSSCGACTVHIDGVATRTCTLPVATVEGKEITTIEGVGVGGEVSAVQAAWIEHQVPQCGYCQSQRIKTSMNASPISVDVAHTIVSETRSNQRRRRDKIQVLY